MIVKIKKKGIKKSPSKEIFEGLFRIFVVLGGFEPPQTEPKPVVLPLHHRTKLRCKGTVYLYSLQIFCRVFAEKSSF